MVRSETVSMTSLLLAAAFLAGRPGDASAHEKGVLKLGSKSFAAGDSVPVAGEKFGPGATLTLKLVGLAGQRQLAEVHAGSTGAFRLTLHLPNDISEGSYRLVAIAEDGDEVAGVDVTVLPAAEVAEHVGHEMAGMPSAEPLALERARNPWVTGGTLAGIGLALVAGIALLRRPRNASH